MGGWRRGRRLLLAILASGVSGCGEWPYYWQATTGEMEILIQRRPVESLLADADTPPGLRRRLMLADRLRRFAEGALLLPSSGTFRDYVDLRRPFVTRVVFATPELSLEPHRWCFPVVGCLAYRGYFDDREARRLAETLRQEGWDVHLSASPAHSTLGWFADPLLNTFIDWPESRLAGLMFHELAHEKIYIPDDTTFNESFAEAVSRIGVERWLERTGQGEALSSLRRDWSERARFVDQVEAVRERLLALYAGPLSQDEKRVEKRAILASAAMEAEGLDGAPGDPEREATRRAHGRWWRDGINNAKILSVGLYSAWVPAFMAILEENHGDLEGFYRSVRALAALPMETRNERLRRGIPDGAARR
ncbi:MAG: aminopeptidase [Magnetococcales bacterium]|nr:aminopeptidase [Magnetococcales bacterium]